MLPPRLVKSNYWMQIDRIRNLEHLLLTRESAHNNTHDSLLQAGPQYDYIDVQDNAIAQLRAENAALTKCNQEEEQKKRMMVLEVIATSER